MCYILVVENTNVVRQCPLLASFIMVLYVTLSVRILGGYIHTIRPAWFDLVTSMHKALKAEKQKRRSVSNSSPTLYDLQGGRPSTPGPPSSPFLDDMILLVGGTQLS